MGTAGFEMWSVTLWTTSGKLTWPTAWEWFSKQNHIVHNHSWWNISLSSLVIAAASVFEILCWKNRQSNKQTNNQTNKHINAAENPTYATTFGVDNKDVGPPYCQA